MIGHGAARDDGGTLLSLLLLSSLAGEGGGRIGVSSSGSAKRGLLILLRCGITTIYGSSAGARTLHATNFNLRRCTLPDAEAVVSTRTGIAR